MFFDIWQSYQVAKDHSKITKIHFWMIQRAKRDVFGHFLESGHFYLLDIEYFDRTKCFPISAALPGHERSFKNLENAFFSCKMTCFDQFGAIFSSLVQRIDFIYLISIVLNGFDDLVMVSLMFCIWVIHYYCNDDTKWPVLRSFWQFSRVRLIGLTSNCIFRYFLMAFTTW